jgi:hypothetical protein
MRQTLNSPVQPCAGAASIKEKRKTNIPNLTDPAFLDALFRRCLLCYFGADQSCNSSGKRFSKEIINDPLFRVNWWLQAIRDQELKGQIGPIVPDKEFRLECKKFLGEQFGDAVEQRNWARVEELTKLCRLYEDKAVKWPERHPRRTRDIIPWSFYIGFSAYRLLKAGTITTESEVEETALGFRAAYDLRMEGVPKEKRAEKIPAKVKELRQIMPSRRHLGRIFEELGLSELLPSA